MKVSSFVGNPVLCDFKEIAVTVSIISSDPPVKAAYA